MRIISTNKKGGINKEYKKEINQLYEKKIRRIQKNT